MDKHISTTLKAMQDEINSFPTYWFPPLIIYYSWVRNVFGMKMDIYKKYQIALVDAEHNESNLKEILSENLYQETTAIEVSLEKEDFGQIRRISPDYMLYLGYVPDEDSPIGVNINVLLPDMFQDIHSCHMRDTSALFKISNNLRNVLINKFDGYLTKARFVLKI